MVAWRVQGNLKVITADVKARRPKATVYSVGDASHASRSSDHNPWNWGYGTVVSAIDIMIRGGFTDNDAKLLIKSLIGRSDIQYIIYRGTIWNRTVGNWKARKYTGSDQHYDHVHVSATHSSSADRTVKHINWGSVTVTVSAKAKPRAKFVLPAWTLGSKAAFHPYLKSKPPTYGTIRNIQKKLYSIGYNLTADGQYGPGTYKAILNFQTKNKLKVDGIIGPKTYAALRAK